MPDVSPWLTSGISNLPCIGAAKHVEEGHAVNHLGEGMVEDDAPADLEAEDIESDLPPAPDGAVHCRVCTILIGPGYVESEPIPDPEGRGGFVCWRCFESLQRQAERRA